MGSGRLTYFWNLKFGTFVHLTERSFSAKNGIIFTYFSTLIDFFKFSAIFQKMAKNEKKSFKAQFLGDSKNILDLRNYQEKTLFCQF